MKRVLTFLASALVFAGCTNNSDIEPPEPPVSFVEPALSFTVGNNNCKAPCEVSFTSTAKQATSYFWGFGDGQTSTQANPRHTYPNVGVYEVTLTANGAGSSSTTSQQVKINPYQKVWDKAFGGTVNETYSTLLATADGGFLLGGSPAYTDSPLQDHTVDFNVLKVGADGIAQWSKTYGGSRYDGLTTMAATSDGGFLVGGSSESPVSSDKSEALIGERDVWLVKIGRDGTKQWDKTIGRKGTKSSVQTIMATTDSGFRLVVDTYTYVDKYDILNKEMVSIQNKEVWTIQLGQNGETKGSEMPWGYDKVSVATPDGNFLFVNAPSWVVKISAHGTKQWEKLFSVRVNDNLHTIVPASDGGFLLGGTAVSSSGPYIKPGERDYWVIKINAEGQKQWEKTLGGSYDDELKTMVATPDGGFLLGGWSASSVSGDKTENSRGYIDYWVVKIDASGTRVWEKTFGGTSQDWLSSIVPTSDGGFLLGGLSESPPSGDKSGGSGASNYWVIKLQ